MSLRGTISQILRSTGLLTLADQLRMQLQKQQFRTENLKFRDDFPDVVLPDDAIMYETFNLNYHKYYFDGKAVANWLLDTYQDTSARPLESILDWGCGPARVIRHMPELTNPDTQLFGSDFNPDTIKWCRTNIDDVSFSCNQLDPPLPYPSGSFDFVYGISVFTHLSEARHQHWAEELHRVLSPGGILLASLQGEAFLPKLTRKEQERFHNSKLVVRGSTEEGRRVFSAFHPKEYVEQLFAKFEVIDHQPGKKDKQPQQDIWVLQKL